MEVEDKVDVKPLPEDLSMNRTVRQMVAMAILALEYWQIRDGIRG